MRKKIFIRHVIEHDVLKLYQAINFGFPLSHKYSQMSKKLYVDHFGYLFLLKYLSKTV